MKHVLLIGLFSIVVSGLECPPEYFEAGNGCFAVFDQPSPAQTDLTWDEARALCQAQEYPGWSCDLATFDGTEQLEAVSEVWSFLSDGAYPYMWVGISRHSGKWQYVDGRPISLTSNIWRESHPHDMNMHVYLDDVSLSTGVDSYGRLYASCTMGEVMRRYMCRAKILYTLTVYGFEL
ncbi:C-type lectin 1-like [Palaemon carinicauda]|uniref:C-type lectin 1-like n=1 Tax=Palaemon carinicauda TaxID=392227 RepID=UPI0035B59167